jgi:CcmD family protein
MNTMTYLAAAFMAIWVLLAVYLFLLWSREKNLRKEIDRLRRSVEKSPPR